MGLRWESRLDRHAADNDRQFGEIAALFRKHDENVEAKHQQNTETMARIEETLNGVVKLQPAIEAGIAADAAADYRKKLVRRVILAVLSTLLAVSGLIPLIQWMISLKLSVHMG